MKSEDGKEIQRVEITKGFALNQVSFSTDSSYIACASGDCTVRIYDLKTKKKGTHIYNNHDSEVLGCGFNCNSTLLASCGAAGELHVFKVNEKSFEHKFKQSLNDYKIPCIQFSHIKEHQLATGHDDGTVAIWDCAKSKLNFKFDPQHQQSVTGVTFSTLNHMLMGSVGIDQKLIFYDVYKGRSVIEQLNVGASLSSVSFCSDGHTVGAGTIDGRVLIFDLRKLKDGCTMEIKAHDQAVQDVRFQNAIKSSKSTKGKPKTSASNKSSFKSSTKEAPPKPQAAKSFIGKEVPPIEEIKVESVSMGRSRASKEEMKEVVQTEETYQSLNTSYQR